MAKKILIASGDSWTGGTHRDKPNSYPYWPEILADKLNMDYINFGRGGKGNEFIYNNMLDALCVTKTIRGGLAICLWSKFDRWDLCKWTFRSPGINDPQAHYPYIVEQQFRTEVELLRREKFVNAIYENKDLVSETYSLLKSIRWFHAFQNHCELQNIPYLQMQGFRPTHTIKKEFFDCPQFDFINDDKFIGWPIYKELGGKSMWQVLDEVDPKRVELRVSKEDLHPNDKGHERIAEVMYEKYKKIYE